MRGSSGRILKDKVVSWIIGFAVAVFCVLFLSIILSVLIKGAPSLSFDLVFRLPTGGFYLGREGGILNAIAGSLILAGGATALAFLISLPLVLFINVYLRKGSRFAFAVRFALDVLWGVPSIVYGACGISVMLAAGFAYSLLAGIIVVAVMEIPILARALDEVLAMVPRDVAETGFSLGASARQVSFRIILKGIGPGIVTALLLAFGRGIGDAAAVMLVAGFQDGIPSSLFEPVATLPLSIYYLVNSPLPEVRARGYAAGVILILIILAVSVFARFVSWRFSRFKFTSGGGV